MAAPFSFGVIARNDFYTNRSHEMKLLSGNFRSGINTILISPRRWGKSSLVWNTAKRIMRKDKKIRFCFIDLFNVRTEHEFYEAYARELIKASDSKWEDRVRSVRKFFTRLIPQINLPVDPQNDICLRFEWKNISQSPDEILDLAENISRTKKIRMVVCMDEFQNLTFFKDPIGFQKKLRSHWQKHQLTTYCLYGSKRQMMSALFESSSMPFYKFGDVIFLSKIERNHWIDYIMNRFSSTGKSITAVLAARIAETMEDHPYFVQQLAQETWQQCPKKCESGHIDEALESLLNKLSILYQRETDHLSNGQVNFLRAVCDGVTRFSTREVLEKYQIGTSAASVKIKRALEQKEVIDTFDQEVRFTDPLYKCWFFKYMMGA